MKMSTVISLINLKGGVGKTVSSINIAYSLAKLEKLRGCDAHFSNMMPEGDGKTYKSLGIETHSEPVPDVKVSV